MPAVCLSTDFRRWSLEVQLVIRINIVPCLRVMKVKKIFWNLICLGWNNVRNIKSQSLWYWLCFLCEILPQFVENSYKVNTSLCFTHYVSNNWSSKSCFYFCILSYFNTFFFYDLINLIGFVGGLTYIKPIFSVSRKTCHALKQTQAYKLWKLAKLLSSEVF